MGNCRPATDHVQLLRDRLAMENLRPLYDGIVDLRRLTERHSLKTPESVPESDEPRKTETHIKELQAEPFGAAELETAIKGDVCTLVKHAYDSEHHLLWQSPIFSLCRFWHDMYKQPLCNSSGPNSHAVTTITRMLLLYDLLQRLAEMGTAPKHLRYMNDDLPYCFENICEYIRRITDCRNAYIIHQVGCGDTQIVCRSAFLADELEEKASRSSASYLTARQHDGGKKIRSVSAEDFSFLLRQTDKDGVHFITDMDCQDSDTENCPESLKGDNHIVILLARVGFRKEENLYLILQAPDWSELPGVMKNEPGKQTLSECVVTKISRVLFLRKHLVEAVEQHYERLLNNRYECGFVKFFPPQKTDSMKREYPNILHLTDLHADDRFKGNQDKILEELQAKNPTKAPVDLLIISGDIADAKGGSAAQVQENYHYAEVFLTKLVIQLWGKEEKDDSKKIRVPFDWRRRVLFVPGNHDFASMNLLQIVQQRRRLAAGLPTDGANGIVAKFSYYLDFLLRFLDAPIDMFIRNSINEVREYRSMHTKVFMMNSSFGSSAARTNKVALDNDTVMRLSKENAWGDCDHMNPAYRIIVVHHPYTWPVDYLLDGYSSLDNDNWDWNWQQEKNKYLMRDEREEWHLIINPENVVDAFENLGKIGTSPKESFNELYFLFGEALRGSYPVYEEIIHSEMTGASTAKEKTFREIIREKHNEPSDPQYLITRFSELFIDFYDRMEKRVNTLNLTGHHNRRHYFTKDAASFRAILDKRVCDILEEDEQLMHRLFRDLQRANDDWVSFGKAMDTLAQDATVLLCGHQHMEKVPKTIEPSTKALERVVVGGKLVIFKPNSEEAYLPDKYCALYITAEEVMDEDPDKKGIRVKITPLFKDSSESENPAEATPAPAT